MFVIKTFVQLWDVYDSIKRGNYGNLKDNVNLLSEKMVESGEEHKN